MTNFNGTVTYDAFDEEQFMQALSAAEAGPSDSLGQLDAYSWEPAMATTEVRVTNVDGPADEAALNTIADQAKAEAGVADPTDPFDIHTHSANTFADAVQAAHKAFANEGKNIGEGYEIGQEKLAYLSNLSLRGAETFIQTPTTRSIGSLAAAGASR